MDTKVISVKSSAGDNPALGQDNSIYLTIAPFLKLSRICGLTPLVLEKSSTSTMLSKSFISTLYSLILTIVLPLLFYLSLLELNKFHEGIKMMNSISHLASWGQIYTIFGVFMVAHITGIYFRSLGVRIFDKVAQIDRQLYNLGIPISYRGCQRELSLQLMILLIIPAGASMCLCAMISGLHEKGFELNLRLCYWFICFTPILLITLKEFQYYNLVRLIKNKVLALNRSLKKLVKWENVEGQNHKELKLKIIKTHLESFRLIHSDIVDLTKDVQAFFGPFILVSVISAFGVITIQLYYIFATLIQTLHFNIPMTVITLIWTATQALLILANVHICSSTRNVCNEIGGTLITIREAVEHPEIFHIVQLFSFQLWHKKIQFSACGFFRLDSKLITSIVAAVTTYLVLMIQFHLSNNENVLNKCNEGDASNGTM